MPIYFAPPSIALRLANHDPRCESSQRIISWPNPLKHRPLVWLMICNKYHTDHTIIHEDHPTPHTPNQYHSLLIQTSLPYNTKPHFTHNQTQQDARRPNSGVSACHSSNRSRIGGGGGTLIHISIDVYSYTYTYTHIHTHIRICIHTY